MIEQKIHAADFDVLLLNNHGPTSLIVLLRMVNWIILNNIVTILYRVLPLLMLVEKDGNQSPQVQHMICSTMSHAVLLVYNSLCPITGLYMVNMLRTYIKGFILY